ncbi:MAG: hypothetical protein NT062_35960 [Proteobacteria bacterium]|nr:hypothetical protein [Pseudomonadota bacterium]
MRIGGMVAVLAGLASCGPTVPIADSGPSPEGGPGPVADDGAQSGARLKIQWLELEGTRTWNGFYDAALAITCHLRTWADGTTYCSPDGGAQVAYADASCGQAIGRVYRGTSCAPPTPAYVLQYSDGCAYRPAKLYPTQTKIAVTSWYSKGADGTCFGPYAPASYDFYALGAELPPSTLAPVTLGAPFGAGRLGQRDYTSADGMYLPGTVHDAVAGLDCYPTYRYAGATTGTCVPTDAGYLDYFRDPTCTDAALTVPEGCVAPDFAVRYDDYCPTTEGRYFAVGAEVPSPSLYVDGNGTCYPTTAGTDHVFETGRELALAAIHRSHDNSNGRYALIHYDTDGVHLRDTVLYDQEQQSECFLYPLADGTTRCLPNANSVTTFFTDAACTTAIDLMEVYLGEAGCSPPPLTSFALKYVPPAANACGTTYEVHAAMAQYTGAIYANYGSCTPYATDRSALYRVGPAIPMTTFPAAISSHD